MCTSRVVGDVLPADGVCVARKLCPCTRSRQTHALGSVGAFPNALQRRKGPQRTPHSAQKRPTKSRRVGPQPPTVPQRKGHPLGNLVKADDAAVRHGGPTTSCALMAVPRPCCTCHPVCHAGRWRHSASDVSTTWPCCGLTTERNALVQLRWLRHDGESVESCLRDKNDYASEGATVRNDYAAMPRGGAPCRAHTRARSDARVCARGPIIQ